MDIPYECILYAVILAFIFFMAFLVYFRKKDYERLPLYLPADDRKQKKNTKNDKTRNVQRRKNNFAPPEKKVRRKKPTFMRCGAGVERTAVVPRPHNYDIERQAYNKTEYNASCDKCGWSPSMYFQRETRPQKYLPLAASNEKDDFTTDCSTTSLRQHAGTETCKSNSSREDGGSTKNIVHVEQFFYRLNRNDAKKNKSSDNLECQQKEVVAERNYLPYFFEVVPRPEDYHSDSHTEQHFVNELEYKQHDNASDNVCTERSGGTRSEQILCHTDNGVESSNHDMEQKLSNELVYTPEDVALDSSCCCSYTYDIAHKQELDGAEHIGACTEKNDQPCFFFEDYNSELSSESHTEPHFFNELEYKQQDDDDALDNIRSTERSCDPNAEQLLCRHMNNGVASSNHDMEQKLSDELVCKREVVAELAHKQEQQGVCLEREQEQEQKIDSAAENIEKKSSKKSIQRKTFYRPRYMRSSSETSWMTIYSTTSP